MDRREHLLSCLAEECAEVAQRVSKALRFGLNEVQPGQPYSNRERIAQELDDLFAVANILMEERVITQGAMTGQKIAAKRAKIEKFMAISRKQGALCDNA